MKILWKGWAGTVYKSSFINPLNVELKPIYHFVPLLGAHPIIHVSRITVTLNGTIDHSQVNTLRNYYSCQIIYMSSCTSQYASL
jgi:hypothetical protein